jgi:hypothetical protein
VALEQKRVKTANGRSYIRYRQTYAGLDVFGAEVIVQVSATGARFAKTLYSNRM